jgi:hypothetical protein
LNKKLWQSTTVLGLLGLLISANSAYADPAPITVRPSMAHPNTNSLGEPPIGVNFGTTYDKIQGDFRATFGSNGRTVKPTSVLGFTQSTTVGATSGSIQPSILNLINVDPSLLDKTGYNVYYVGGNGDLDTIKSNLSKAIDQYAQLRNGNALYIKELLLDKLQAANGYYENMSTNDFGDFGLKDMFVKFDWDKLAFRPAYIGQFSGDGKVQTLIDQVPQRVMKYDSNGNLIAEETDESYYAQPMKSYQTTSSPWPNITSIQEQPNGDVTYTATVYGSNGTAGKADLIANWDQNKTRLPSLKLDTLDDYWRKMVEPYYADMVTKQAAPGSFQYFMKSLPDFAYTNADHQDVTYTIPASDIQSIVDSSRTDNTVTLYVTDMFGRYVSKTIPYQIMQVKPNLSLTTVWYSPDPAQPKQTVNTSVQITNSSNQTITTDLVATSSYAGKIGEKTITLQPGQTIRDGNFSYTAPDAQTDTLTYTINPNHDSPNNESNWADNVTETAVNIQRPQSSNNGLQPVDFDTPDAMVMIDKAPVVVKYNTTFSYYVTVYNFSKSANQIVTTVHQPYKISYQKCDLDGCYWVVEDRSVDKTFSDTFKPMETKSYPMQGEAGWDVFDNNFDTYSTSIQTHITSIPGEKNLKNNQAQKVIPVKTYTTISKVQLVK